MRRAFYERSPLRVAPDLLGRLLVHDAPEGRTSGRIVEVEAYCGERDPASHAYRGRTARNATMFGAAGHLYVYFTYGMHYCINLVCGDSGSAAAVLVRALEPVDGLDLMRARRGVDDVRRLARGPGCVARALGLHRRDDGIDLTRGPVWLADAPPERGGHRIARGPRIGIRVATDRPWRFWLAGHACVSGRAGARAAAGRPRGETVARRHMARRPRLTLS